MLLLVAPAVQRAGSAEVVQTSVAVDATPPLARMESVLPLCRPYLLRLTLAVFLQKGHTNHQVCINAKQNPSDRLTWVI